jgi:thiaminase (transcriptional activator TenA)
MKFSERAWERITPLYEKILAMPFNQELMKGTLEKEKFKFYMAQDAFYLGEFGKTLSTLSGRLDDLNHVLAFSEFAGGAIVVERALHESYFKEFGIPDKVNPSPTCLLYTNYILNQAAYSNVEVGVAGVLPCFWIYKQVGDYIYTRHETAGHPYQRWIETYAGEEFAQSVKLAIEITDALAEKASPEAQEKMLEAFEMASKLEWMFWDSAYRMEKWEV